MKICSDNHIATFALVLSLLLFLGGCAKKDIEGVVSDPFGNGIEGVGVQILKSQFKAITNASGEYTVDYAPGVLTVQFAKSGYTTHTLELSIQEKSKYPAENVILYPIPKGEGLFFAIGDSGLVELAPLATIKEYKEVTNMSGHWIYRMSEMAASLSENRRKISIKEGKIVFVDVANMPEPSYALFKLGEGNVLHDRKGTWQRENEYIYNGLIVDKQLRVGEEKLLLRTVELVRGTYAWCAVVRMRSGQLRPDPSGGCFWFEVIG